MTIVISALGFLGRAAGRLVTTALGWAGNLLFGRVPQSHQVFVSLMMAGSLLWIAMILLTLIPGLTPVLLNTTPHPAAIGLALVRFVVLFGLILLPLGVGLAGYLAPAQEERPVGLAAFRQIFAGYPIALLMPAILILLAGVGISRKVVNARRGWSDTHVAIVVKPGGYDRMVADLQTVLASADLPVDVGDAPRVLSLPGQFLGMLAGGNVRRLVPDRLVQLNRADLAIDLYPFDIAISGDDHERMRARIAIVSQIPWTAAYLTTSAEAQAVEDRLEGVEGRLRPPAPGSTALSRSGEDLAAVDRALLDAELPTDEWDILYRLRLQVERDVLAAQVSATGNVNSTASNATPRSVLAAR
jgi:hypothetical protein